LKRTNRMVRRGRPGAAASSADSLQIANQQLDGVSVSYVMDVPARDEGPAGVGLPGAAVAFHVPGELLAVDPGAQRLALHLAEGGAHGR
jgi:hypothetical protein